VIPKSTREERIRKNMHVFDFELTEPQMRLLETLNSSRRYCWNPETVL